jgi:shikimate kinase
MNEFVDYLNTLQKCNGNNQNAIAENNVCNNQFEFINVKHPWTDPLLNLLRNSLKAQKIIITGRAGDGKTTIAAEVVRQLIDDNSRFLNIIKQKKIELILPTGIPLVVIKDFSERTRSEEEESQLLKQLINSDVSVLLVSNTGSLVDFIRNRAFLNQLGKESTISAEQEILRAIREDVNSSIKTITIGPLEFDLYNLINFFNLPLARQMFKKMLNAKRWLKCNNCPMIKECPIFKNYINLSNNEEACDRLFQIYRRMYEYGFCYTMRQLSEHLAFCITGGLEEHDLADSPISAQSWRYLFENNVFGGLTYNFDVGKGNNLQIVKDLKKTSIGRFNNSTWNRLLWTDYSPETLIWASPEKNVDFKSFQKEANNLITFTEDINLHKMKKARIRECCVRQIFFFAKHKDGIENQDFKGFLCDFLQSTTFFDFIDLQTHQKEKNFEKKVRNNIIHVLKQYYSGVRLPYSDAQNDTSVFITMNRHGGQIRQSAQVIMATFRWDHFKLQIQEYGISKTDIQTQALYKRKIVFLEGKNDFNGVDLKLTLPFLDYLYNQSEGEYVNSSKQEVFFKRLDKFKLQIIEAYKKNNDEDSNSIMLVRLGVDHQFKERIFSLVNENTLEVDCE